MKPYKEQYIVGNQTLNLDFVGPDADNYLNEKDKLYNSSLTLGDNEHTKWTKINYNINVPSQAWNGHKLVATNGTRIFIAIGNEIHELNTDDGSTKWKKSFTSGAIRIVELTPDKKRILIVYSWCDINKSDSNLYCLDLNGNLLWALPRISEMNCVTNINLEDKILNAWTFDCFRIEIDSETGKIISKEWTK